MNRIVFSLLTLLSVTASGQVKIFNKSLTDSSLAIVYLGVENNISLVIGSQKITRVTALNATLIKTGPYTYMMKPILADSAVLYCYNKDRLILRKAFGIHRLGQPAGKLGNINSTSNTVTLNEVLANTTVSVQLVDCYYKHDLVPYSYRFRIEDVKNGWVYSKVNYGNKLTEEQIELLKICTSENMIVLDNFRTTTDTIFGVALSTAIYIK